MIRAVFMDIDDTLLSFSGFVRQAMRQGFEKYGLKPYTEDMFDTFNRVNGGLWRDIERGALTMDGLRAIRWNRIFDALGISFDGVMFEAYFRNALFESAIPEPHALETLQYLSGRYALCVASNGPYDQQLNRLRVGGMAGYFAHVFVSERLGVAKPHPAFFDRCFDALRAAECPGLQPGEAVIVGDSLTSDMAGGRAYGMRTCLCRKGAPSPQDRAAADWVVSDLAELRRIL